MTMNNKNKYFLYARKSSEAEDRQITSIDDQVKVMQEVADKEGLEVVKVFKEAKSAKTLNRPIFNDMLQRIERGKANGILCFKPDRLARNMIDGGRIMEMLQTGKIKHIQAYDSEHRPEDNILVMAVSFGMSAQFSKDLAVNVKRGMTSKAERGEYPSCAPLGYINKREGAWCTGSKRPPSYMVKDPDRFELVRKVFDLFLADKIVGEVFNDIYKMGLRTRTNKKVSKSQLYRILKNPIYYGEFEWPANSGNIYQGNHTPMINKEEFEQIQDIFKRGSKKRYRTHNFTYKGLFRCEECGGMVTASKVTKKQKNGNVHEYIYYHCGKSKDPNCQQRSKMVREEVINNEVLKELEKIEIPQDIYQWAMDEIKAENKTEGETRRKVLEEQQRAYDRACNRLERLVDMRADGEITAEQYAERKTQVEQDKKYYKDLLDSIDDKMDKFMNKIDEVFKFAVEGREKFKNTKDVTEKRTMLASLNSNLYIKDGKIKILVNTYFKPFIKYSSQIQQDGVKFKPLETPVNKTKTEPTGSVNSEGCAQ